MTCEKKMEDILDTDAKAIELGSQNLFTVPLMRSIKQTVSRKLGKDVKKLARELDLEESDIAEVEDTNSYEFCFRMLTLWEQQMGNLATLGHLVEALKKIDRNDLIQKLGCDEQIDKSQVTSSCVSRQESISSLDLKNAIEALKTRQRELNQDIMLPQLPWTDKELPLDELFVDLNLTLADKYGNESNEEPIELQKLFAFDDRRDCPTRILIESGPGNGKTSLALKILTDWTKGEIYLTRFKCVFLFTLDSFSQYDSIEEALAKKFAEAGVDEEVGFECMNRYGNSFLFILDGFDEVAENFRQRLIPLLKRKSFPDVCVVLTSLGIVNVGDDTKNRGELKKRSRYDEFWDSVVYVKGVSKTAQNQFIAKYFSNNAKQIKKAKKVALRFGFDLIPCPLLLVLLVFFVEDEVDCEVESEVSFFKFLFNSILRRSLHRQGFIEKDTEIDLFDSDQPDCSKYRLHLINFGKIALEHLLKGNFYFDDSEILRCCDNESYFLKLGFFTKKTVFCKRNRMVVYQPNANTLLEFASAFYLTSLKCPSTEFQEIKSQMIYTKIRFRDFCGLYAMYSELNRKNVCLFRKTGFTTFLIRFVSLYVSMIILVIVVASGIHYWYILFSLFFVLVIYCRLTNKMLDDLFQSNTVEILSTAECLNYIGMSNSLGFWNFVCSVNFRNLFRCSRLYFRALWETSLCLHLDNTIEYPYFLKPVENFSLFLASALEKLIADFRKPAELAANIRHIRNGSTDETGHPQSFVGKDNT